MRPDSKRHERYVEAIRLSGHSIYDRIEESNPDLWLPTQVLEYLLQSSMAGLSLAGLPLRTRSKVVKQHVCRALGYPVPNRFRKTSPRFPGQNFDVYVQKSDNLQIWNNQISMNRRYVIIRVNEDDIVTRIWVITGDRLSPLDTSGTLTIKHQARFHPSGSSAELATALDTALLEPITTSGVEIDIFMSPTDFPRVGQLMPIKDIYNKLVPLVGTTFPDAGHDQERNRAASLVRLVCEKLGYLHYRDSGQFPDITHQLLEIKLQTSSTIDLGMIRPDDEERLVQIPELSEQHVRGCDVRYALFYGSIDDELVTISHLVLTTGAKFFDRFPQFQGKIVNQKLQIHLRLPPSLDDA